MDDKRRGIGKKADGSSASLMFTINAISHLSRDEFELLKKLRSKKELNNSSIRKEFESLPEVQKILNDFNVKSIRDVIEIVEKFKLFEIYQF